MQDGSQEPVSKGQDGAAAGAAGGQPGAVTAARIQARLPLLVMQRHQGGDQGIPFLGWQTGQRRMAEPGQIRAGPVKRTGSIADLVAGLGTEGVVPVAVPGVAGHG